MKFRISQLILIAVAFLLGAQLPCFLQLMSSPASTATTRGGRTCADASSSASQRDCPPCPKLSLGLRDKAAPDRHRPHDKVDDDAETTAAPVRQNSIASNSPVRVRVIVFTYDRLKGLRRLLNSLLDAHYDGHEVDLDVFHDFPKDKRKHEKSPENNPPKIPSTVQETRQYLDDFHWPHGRYHLHRRQVNVGLKRSIMEAWYPTGDDEVAAFFEDDTEVSVHWHQWTVKALSKYYVSEKETQPDKEHVADNGEAKTLLGTVDPKILGLSLFRPIHDELSGKGCIVNNGNNPFALQQPCSWGAVYLPKPWRTFRNWYDKHMHEGHTLRDPNDPAINPISNTWPPGSSWKVYLIKLMYQQGWYMIYPNLPGKAVLSTNHLMPGEHNTPPKHLFELPLYESTTNEYMDLLPELHTMSAYDVMFRKKKSIGNLPNHDN